MRSRNPTGGVVVDDDDGGVSQDAENVIAQKARDARDDPFGIDADERADKVIELSAHDEVGGVGDTNERKEDEGGAHLLHGGAVGLAVLDGGDVSNCDFGGAAFTLLLGCPGRYGRR